MRPEGRYWLFFAIVAIGLVLSWGQVGRKTHQVLDAEPIVYLATEADCRPERAPCAAMGGDRGLVLGPASGSSGVGLMLRQTGFVAGRIQSVEVRYLSAAEEELARRDARPHGDGWVVASPPPTATTVRIRVRDDRTATVADFPLQAVATARSPAPGG